MDLQYMFLLSIVRYYFPSSSRRCNSILEFEREDCYLFDEATRTDPTTGYLEHGYAFLPSDLEQNNGAAGSGVCTYALAKYQVVFPGTVRGASCRPAPG